MCSAQLNDGPLVCTRLDTHAAPKGCVYVASAGPDLSEVPQHATGDEQ